MPGGTNLPVLRGLGCGSQTPYPYDAYPLSGRASSNTIVSIGHPRRSALHSLLGHAPLAPVTATLGI